MYDLAKQTFGTCGHFPHSLPCHFQFLLQQAHHSVGIPQVSHFFLISESSSILLSLSKRQPQDFPGSPVFETLLPMQRVLVQSLVGELRSHILWGTAKKKERKKENLTAYLKYTLKKKRGGSPSHLPLTNSKMSIYKTLFHITSTCSGKPSLNSDFSPSSQLDVPPCIFP